MKLRDLLRDLGFGEDWDAITDEKPAYWYDFGNLKLTAVQVTSQYFQPIFMIGKVAHDSRTIYEIGFEMPLEVDSFEQGVAWITQGLGPDFRPNKLTAWIDQGRKWSDTLPWEQDKRRYEARPHCEVDRDWFRVAAKKLREQAASANPTESASVQFDGHVLRIQAAGMFLAMPATGLPWDRSYFLPVSTFDFLPKRIMTGKIGVNVWEGKLHIGRRTFNLVEPGGAADQ